MHLPPPTRRYTDYGPYPTPLMSLKLQLHTSQGYGDTKTHRHLHTLLHEPAKLSQLHHRMAARPPPTTVTSAQTLAHPQVAPRIEQRRRERFYRAVILSNTPTPTPSHTHTPSPTAAALPQNSVSFFLFSVAQPDRWLSTN